MTYCPTCKLQSIPANGSDESDILVVGYAPYPSETYVGAFTDEKAREPLATAMFSVGLNLDMCRRTNLWKHMISSTSKKLPDENHISWHMSQTILEISQHKYVLMLGAELAKLFTKYTISDINGLWIESKYFEGKEVLFCVNPSTVLYGAHGELMFALEQFAKRIKNDPDLYLPLP